jgi:Ca-activated chloride channel family protein
MKRACLKSITNAYESRYIGTSSIRPIENISVRMKTEMLRKSSRKAVYLFLLLSHIYLLGCSQNIVRTVNETSTDKCLSPYFVVLSENSSAEQLPLKSTKVNVNIAGVIADVEVKQVYSNTGKTPIEAVYIFPASTRAGVYQMIMKVNEREIVAVVEEKQTARNMYEQAKQEGKTASLLEEQRPNVFQMNVANIVPEATVEVTMNYTELLVPTDGIYEFVYPTVVGPRYVSNSEVENNTAQTWTANPYLEEGTKPTSTLDIQVNVVAGMPIKEIKCETHKNQIKYTDKSSASVTIDDKFGGNKDFVLDYRLSGNAIESGMLVYEDPKGEKYFLAMMQPPQRVNPEMVAPREYVFVVDVSGSMSGFPLEVSKQTMRKILNSLKQTDKFNIVLFAGGSEVYSDKSLNATQDNITKAISYVNNLSGSGGTELLSALQTAMKLNSDENYSRSFVILTDGYVSVEKEAFDFIKNNLGNANFFAFGIGSSVNRYIIEGMAHVGYGEPFIALDEKEGPIQAEKFIKYISKPVLTSIDFKFNGFETYDVLPERMPDLFAERPLIVTGKFKGSASGTINFSGKTGNQNYQQSWDISENLKPGQLKAIKYLWAREKIRLLADYNKIGETDELKSQIVQLGKSYNLLTEYTSFIAIDSEISNAGGNQTTIKQPLPLPDGVSNNAIGGYAMTAKAGGNYLKRAENSVNFTAPVVVEENESPAEQISEDGVWFVEEPATFQGGDIATFREYIQKHLVYPKEAIEKGLQGNVIIQFTIDQQGNITDVKVLRGIDKVLDDEAVRVILASPKWAPGKQSGTAVKTNMVIPVEFVLTK